MKKKKRSFFKKALFVASLKSNFVSYLVVTLGNAFILLVVIFILSTLSINVTKDSMSNMFNSASMERQIKEAGVTLYLSYGESIEAYDTLVPYLGENAPVLYEGSIKLMELHDGTYDTYIKLVNKDYDLHYSSALNTGETEEEKHLYAKEKTLATIDTLLPLFGLGEQVEEIFPYFLTEYLDNYHLDRGSTIPSLIEKSLNDVISSYGKAVIGLKDEEIIIVQEELSKAFLVKDKNKYSEESKKIADAIVDRFSAALVDFYHVDVPTELLLDSYSENKEAYSNNTIIEGEIGYKDLTYINVVSTIMGQVFMDNYYLEALPPFVVEYVTNERGIPYYIENGEEILILDGKDRDKLVPIKSGMGKKSNILEKQYKDILTGSPYTEEEFAKAIKDSEAFFAMGYEFTNKFLKLFVKNKEEFINDDLSIKEDNLIDKVSTDLKEFAVTFIKQMFKEDKIEDITKDKYGLDGKELLEKVYDYSISSIAVYKVEYKKCLEKNYDMKTSLLVSLVKASDTLTDQLPEDIYNKLTDLSSRNLYGLVIGSMFFSMAGLLLPMVYAIMTSNSLVAQEVEDGSLAFVVSSPIKRTSIIMTKAIYQIIMITSMFLFLFVVGVCARQIAIRTGGDDFASSFTVKDLSLYTLGAYLVILAISGICFFTSSYFNKTKYSLGVGGGLAIFFLVTSILGLFGLDVMPLALRIDSMNIFNYVTIIRLFDVQAIMDGNVIFYYKIIGLIAITLITYVGAVIEFNRKDLPL